MKKKFVPGWKRDKPDSRDRFFVPPPRPFHLPVKVDLRAQLPTRCYDQGRLGSCTANAIGILLEFCQVVQRYRFRFEPSRLFIYWNEREMIGTINEDSGAYIRDGIKSVAAQGVCADYTWPYKIERFKEKPPEEAYKRAMLHQALEYARVPQSLESLKECLANGFPFAFGFMVYPSFMSEKTAKTGEVKMPSFWEKLKGAEGGHAVACVGYDDKKKCFIVRNSWGNGWGDKGHFYMPYKYLTDKQLSSDFWVIRLTEDNAQNEALALPRFKTGAPQQ